MDLLLGRHSAAHWDFSPPTKSKLRMKGPRKSEKSEAERKELLIDTKPKLLRAKIG